MDQPLPLPRNEIRPVRGEALLRALHRCVPLGRQFHPLMTALNSPHGLFALPLGPARLLMPASWAKSATRQLLVSEAANPELQLLPALMRDLPPGSLVDVGANIGLYTVMFRTLSAAPIFAYEPQPFLCQLLRWNLEFNGLADTAVRNVACGAEPGEVLMHAGLNGSVALAHETTTAHLPASPAAETWEAQAARAHAGRQWERVPVVTLDAELPRLERVALLKVDCEGYELNILRGAAQLLAQPGLRLFLEIHPPQLRSFGQSAAAVIDLLAARFDLEFWTYEHSRPASKLGRSLAKFRRPVGYRFATTTECLRWVEDPAHPGVVYCLGRSRN